MHPFERHPIVDTGNGQKAVVSDLTLVLGTYNSERARGIVHTPEWRAAMQQLQEQFNDQWSAT